MFYYFIVEQPCGHEPSLEPCRKSVNNTLLTSPCAINNAQFAHVNNVIILTSSPLKDQKKQSTDSSSLSKCTLEKLESYKRFSENQWLNDDCINDYMVIIEKKLAKSKVFSSFFYITLCNKVQIFPHSQDFNLSYKYTNWKMDQVYMFNLCKF